MNTRGFHVYAALEGSLGLDAIREALPAGTPPDGVPGGGGSGGSEIQHGADLVIVGCSQAHDQALEVISAASAQRSDRPVVVLYHGSPTGSSSRPSRRGRTISSRCRSRPASWLRAREGARPSPRRGCVGRRGIDDHGARAEGRDRQDGDVLEPRGRSAIEDRTSVLVDLDLQFGDVGLALGLEPTKTIYDLAVSGGTLDGDKIDSFLAQHSPGARAPAPPRPDQPRRSVPHSCARSSRSSARGTTSSSSTRLRPSRPR